MSLRQRYRELARKVDAFFARVHEHHREDMACGAGCADCCHVRLSVSLVEAAEITDGLASLPAAKRARLAAVAARAEPGVCAALDAQGRCGIYAWRPLVCRSHGAPIRIERSGPDGRRLPVVESCPLNFRDGGPASAPEQDVFDQTTMSTVLAALDIAYAREIGAQPGGRVDLAALLRDERH